MMNQLGWVTFAAMFLAGCGAAPPRTGPDHVAPPRITVALRFTDAPETAPPMASEGSAANVPPPRTHVVLVLIEDDRPRRTEVVGDMEGVCDYEPASPGELLHAKCAFLGAPTHLSVTKQNDGLVVRRGDGTVLRTVALPAKAEVQALPSASVPAFP